MTPAVSVVIPTTGRPELLRAISSALVQTLEAELEIVVVADLSTDALERPSSLRDTDIFTFTGGRLGGGAARNHGVRASRGQWIAFLDDDDEWLPNKLSVQLGAAQQLLARGVEPLVASRHVQVDARSGRTSGVIPKSPYTGDRTVAEYLFRNRRPGGGRSSVYTSTLLLRREIAIEHGWDETLRRHQDWDWVIRLTTAAGVRLVQVPDALVRVHTGSAASVSAGSNWEDSLAWADRVLLGQAPGVYEDFLAAQTLRYALSARSTVGAKAVLSRLARGRRLPALGPSLIAAAGLMPRKSLETMMTRLR